MTLPRCCLTRIQSNMRYSLLLFLLLVVQTTRFLGQSINDLPLLPIWYELKSCPYQYPTYFENFDTARGGNNAVTFFLEGPSRTVTLYNRFVRDTTDLFTWPRPFVSACQLDLNGDGIRDVYADDGTIYQGNSFGVPPTLTQSSGKYPIFSATTFTPVDVDGDNKEDVVIASEASPLELVKPLGKIVFGSSDLSKMQTLDIITLGDTSLFGEDRYQTIASAYKLSTGEFRIITLTQKDPSTQERIHIWRIEFRKTDSVQIVSTRKLASLATNGMRSGVLFSTPGSEHVTLKLGPNTYSLDNDKFELLFSSDYRAAGFKTRGSINSMLENGWTEGSYGKDTLYCTFNSGNPRIQHKGSFRVITKLPFGSSGVMYLERFLCVGDLNHDGFNDFLAYYIGNDDGRDTYRLVFYLGIDTTQSSVEAENYPRILSHANPLRRDEILRLNISRTFNSATTLDLFNLDGKLVTNIWSGSGQTIPSQMSFDLKSTNISPGIYNLKLRSGDLSFDSALVIVE